MDAQEIKQLKELQNAYLSVYEEKKVDQDEDGDNDFADVRIARMIASGMSRAEAIAAVKNKEYNEEVEIDEATRMRKELGKEGEIATRQELARRSNAYQRSGSVDKTIAAAERGAERTTARNRDESEGDYATRMKKRSSTLNKLAANRRGSVRDKPRTNLRGYAAKVQGDDKDLQSARGSARSAGTLTPKEKKQLGEQYNLILSYLLDEGYAETLQAAEAIVVNMSENWIGSIVEQGVSKMGNPVTDALPWNRNTKYTTQGTVRKPGENVRGQQTGIKSNTSTSTMGGPRPAGSKLGTTTPRDFGGGTVRSTTVQPRKPLVSTPKPGPSNNFGREF